MHITIVIPAYNAAKKIKDVISDLKQQGYTDIVAVDDGSRDNTYEILKKSNVTALQHCINRGQGAALRTGIAYARKNADIIVTFDADGQHLAKDIPKLIKALKEKQVDAALGSRFLDNSSNVPFFRKIFLKGGVLAIWLMYGIKLTDVHNGLRALTKKAAQKIVITGDRMEHASEILEQIKRKRIKYCEVPVEIRYTDYSLQQGQSTLNAFKILFKMIFNKLMR